MVFFVCEGCNETLKKNKVDAHAARCRNCWAVSCVDCSVVFEGNDYAAHTSCISEAQKYEGSLYREKSKTGGGKKLSAQERWVEVVQQARAPAGDAKLQGVLSRVASYDNVPRKRAKFVNFMKNSVASADAATVGRVWEIYERDFKAASEAENPAEEAAEESPTVEASDAGKKRKAEIDGDEGASKKSKKEEEASGKPVKWAKLIRKALKAEGKDMELAVLETSVLTTIKDKKLGAGKSDAELKQEFAAAVRKESDKFAVVEVVRLA
jgi:cell growth-regulating nucleolar protein